MLLLFAAGAVVMVSCSDLLTEKPYSVYSSDDYFSSLSHLNYAVLGVYEVQSEIESYGQYMMVYDNDDDISFIQGASLGHVARDLGHYNVYPSHSWLESTWGLMYKGIDRANTILAKYNQVPLTSASDTATMKRYVAEAKALRAFCYFDLVRLWGDVPFKTDYSTASDNFKIARTDREIVYDQIISDMTEAIPNLPWYDAMGTYDGRLSKGAVMGLLARTYLYRAGYSLRQNGTMSRPDNYLEYYKQAKNWTDSIIQSGKHSLNPSYERVFRNQCEYVLEPKECMYEIQFFDPTGQAKHSSNMGTYNSPPCDISSVYGRANSFIKTMGIFYDKFETGDLRRRVAIGDSSITATSNNKPVAVSRKQSYNWSPGKWRRWWVKGTPKDNNNTDVNVPILRYADVLLMNAEARNEINNGPDATAIEDINQVRRRAFGKAAATPDATVDKKLSDFNYDSFTTYLRLERARELCFEYLRRFDLIRWNILGSTITATAAAIQADITAGKSNNWTWLASQYFTPNKHELYPIPSREIRESGGAIIQNPNYPNQ
jgi:hypothetical protein